MPEIDKEVSAVISRFRIVNARILKLRLLYVICMIGITAWTVHKGTYYEHCYTITSLMLTANIIWVIGDLYKNRYVTKIVINSDE